MRYDNILIIIWYDYIVVKGGNQISDNGAIALANALSTNNSLQTLDLSKLYEIIWDMIIYW